jgi:H+/Cl- antiporter ClcA
MVEQLIWLIFYAIIFGAIGYGAWWLCVKFSMPQPILWIVGGILLIILLLFLARQLGVSGPGPILPLHR